MSQIKSKKVLIDISTDKSSTGARTSRAQVVGLNGPGSDLWKAQPALADAGTRLIKVGSALKDTDAAVKSLEAQLAAARGLRDTTQGDYDVVYGVYVANAQSYAETPEAVASVGLTVRSKNKHALVAPAGVDVSFDFLKGVIQIHVSKTPGVRTFAIEISGEPIGPGTWTRLPGSGAVQELRGYAPGLYWVRAASVRAREQSEYTIPVVVAVKQAS